MNTDIENIYILNQLNFLSNIWQESIRDNTIYTPYSELNISGNIHSNSIRTEGNINSSGTVHSNNLSVNNRIYTSGAIHTPSGFIETVVGVNGTILNFNTINLNSTDITNTNYFSTKNSNITQNSYVSGTTYLNNLSSYGTANLNSLIVTNNISAKNGIFTEKAYISGGVYTDIIYGSRIQDITGLNFIDFYSTIGGSHTSSLEFSSTRNILFYIDSNNDDSTELFAINKNANNTSQNMYFLTNDLKEAYVNDRALYKYYGSFSLGASSNAKWYKLAELTITAQFQEADIFGKCHTTIGGGSNAYFTDFCLRIKQQNPLSGNSPTYELYSESFLTHSDVVGVITQDDASAKKIEIYKYSPESFSTLNYQLFSYQFYLTTPTSAPTANLSLPSGTVILPTGNKFINGNLVLNKNLNVSGTTSLSGDVHVNMNIFPTSDNTQDVGKGSLRFNDGFFGNGITTTSDIKVKENIKKLEIDALKIFLEVDEIEYKLKDGKSGRTHTSYDIREFYKKVLEIGGKDYAFYVNNGDLAGYRSHELLPFFSKAIKQLNEKIEKYQLENIGILRKFWRYLIKLIKFH